MRTVKASFQIAEQAINRLKYSMDEYVNADDDDADALNLVTPTEGRRFAATLLSTAADLIELFDAGSVEEHAAKSEIEWVEKKIRRLAAEEGN